MPQPSPMNALDVDYAVAPAGMIAGQDCSAQINAAVDLAVSTGRKVVSLPAGTFLAGNILIRSGIHFVGLGVRTTILKALPNSQDPVFILDVGPCVNNVIRDMMIQSNGNAGQHAFYLKAQPLAVAPYHGGLWFARFHNLYIAGFDGYSVWMRGGTDGSFLTPMQFIKFDNCQFTRSSSATSRCLVATGQVNQVEYSSCNFDGDPNTGAGVGINIEISREYLNGSVSGPASVGGAAISNVAPKVHSFNVLTSQRAERAILADAVRSLVITGSWFEKLWRALKFDNSSVGVVVSGCHFADAASDGSSGGRAIEVATTSMVTGSGNELSGALDKILVGNNQNQMAVGFMYNGVLSSPVTGYARAVAITNNDIDTRAMYQIIVNAAGTIKTISTYLLPGERITVIANAAGVILDNTSSSANGIRLGRYSTLTLNQYDTATLERSAEFNRMMLVATTGVLA